MGARDLLADLRNADLSVRLIDGKIVVAPKNRLTDELRQAIRVQRDCLAALLTPTGDANPATEFVSLVQWSDADIARFLDRRARLIRWGWAEPDAEALADRLVRREREHDERVSCTDCQHYRPGRCGEHRRAGLHALDVGRDLAALLQRCPAHTPRPAA